MQDFMRAFVKLNKGMFKMPIRVQVWLMLLMFVNVVAPLFYLGRVEAQVVLVTFMAGAMIMTFLTYLTGFSRLLGLAHFLWLPLIYFLWTRLDQIPSEDLFGIWARSVILLNGISLVIDVIDVVRYVSGERAETVAGL